MAGIAILAACGGPAPPPPTLVNLTLTASADANADTSGRGTPVAVRVYQLGSTSGFSGAEFFRLYDADAATLGADLVKRDDYLMAPGQTKTVAITPGPTVKAIGVFGAYRDFQGVTWRALAEVPANKTTDLAVTAGHDGVEIKPAAAKKPGS